MGVKQDRQVLKTSEYWIRDLSAVTAKKTKVAANTNAAPVKLALVA